MRNLRDQKGFSLIELMIVVVIIGILAAIAIPRFSNISDRARQSEADPMLRQIANMQEMYKTDVGEYTTSLPALVNYGLSPTLAADGRTKYFTLSIASATPSAFCVGATPGGVEPFAAGVPRRITQTGLIEPNACGA